MDMITLFILSVVISTAIHIFCEIQTDGELTLFELILAVFVSLIPFVNILIAAAHLIHLLLQVDYSKVIYRKKSND